MVNWSNPSVVAFSGTEDPVAKIQTTARELALAALESGWSGPPYNPIKIAEMLGAKVVPNYDIADARTVEINGKAVIEFNPSQSRERVRFSIAHEAAHLLFPDALEEVRHRGGTGSVKDEWQLEMLCNLAASEFVMPIGSFAPSETITRIPELMKSRARFDVSAEAFMIRFAKTARASIGVFCASPFQLPDGKWSYRVDYYISSPVAPTPPITGKVIPPNSAVYRCTAIGFTDYGVESWLNDDSFEVEYVGIPAYPGNPLPRAIGLVHFERAAEGHLPIKYVNGNALSPRGDEPKIICQLVNNRALKWGGGIARQMAQKYPEAEQAFSHWIAKLGRRSLGLVHVADVDKITIVASLVAQSGYGVSSAPRIRYAALEQALLHVCKEATRRRASVHMPRIGTGDARGDWATIENLVQDTLVRNGISVTVYDLPPKRLQLELL
ncbi:MAG TPA: ImmA/IrrE family metallo-endopeptidase [Acetobacteraceae bacterium]|nr:ImmA/IrrE family metallo-endopeptidase [Acetobacteraceae bacterium]